MRRAHRLLATVLVLALPTPLWAGGITEADLQVTKVDTPDPVLAGQDITYTITVTNAGPNDAINATLVDNVPANTTMVTVTAPPGWVCTVPAAGATGLVNCGNPDFAPGPGAVFTFEVKVDPGVAGGTLIENLASVFSDTPDPQPDENNFAGADTTVDPRADLSVTKTDNPDPTIPGGTLTYTIVATNAGPDVADAAMFENVPTGTTFQSISADPSWSCPTLPPVGGTGAIECDNSNFVPGSATFTLVVTVDNAAQPGDTISNTAEVGAEVPPDPNPENNVDTEDTAVAAPSPANVTGTKTVSGLLLATTPVTYTVVLTNNGQTDQGDNAGHEFTDVLPAEVTLVSATASAGTAVATVATNTVTWDGSIAAGASVTITINATVKAGVAGGTTVSNQGSIAYDSDNDGTNDASNVTDDPGTGTPDDPTTFVVGGVAIAAIPAVGSTGLALLTLLLGLAGVGLARRSQRV